MINVNENAGAILNNNYGSRLVEEAWSPGREKPDQRNGARKRNIKQKQNEKKLLVKQRLTSRELDCYV